MGEMGNVENFVRFCEIGCWDVDENGVLFKCGNVTQQSSIFLVEEMDLFQYCMWGKYFTVLYIYFFSV